MKNRIKWLALAVSFLVGCASPTYYQASGADKRVWGYAEKQIDGALFRVNYLDTYNAGTERTYAYAMFRSAQLAREKGATHFEVLEGMVNRAMLERFMANPVKVGSVGGISGSERPYDANEFAVFDVVNQRLEAAPALTQLPNLPSLQVRTYSAPTYIYVPIAPPPPQQQISLLIRLLNAPSLDANIGFDVQDLLSRLGPKVVRAPLKAA